MQPHAFFTPTCRGCNHAAALADALRQKAIAGPGHDVWAQKPPPLNHPLLQSDCALVSPHTTGVGKAARVNMGRIVAEQLLAIGDGKRPPRRVNPEPCRARRFRRTFGYGPGEPFEAATTG